MKGFPKIRENYTDTDTRGVLRQMIERVRWGTLTADLGSCAANTTTDHAFTDTDTYPVLQGLRQGQYVDVTPPDGLDDGLVYSHAWCPSNDALTIRLGNLTGSPINPDSGDWVIWGSQV